MPARVRAAAIVAAENIRVGPWQKARMFQQLVDRGANALLTGRIVIDGGMQRRLGKQPGCLDAGLFGEGGAQGQEVVDILSRRSLLDDVGFSLLPEDCAKSADRLGHL